MTAFGPAADRNEDERRIREGRELAEHAHLQHIADQGDALLRDLVARVHRDLAAVSAGRPVESFGDDIEALFNNLEPAIVGRALMRAAFELATHPDHTNWLER